MSTTFNVTVNGEVAVVESGDLVLTSGSKGVYTASYSVDDAWSDLTLEAVFISAPGAWPTNPTARDLVRRSVALTNNSASAHPDTLTNPGHRLWAGLQGLDANGEIIKCSTLAVVGKIQQGADPDGPGDGDIPESRYKEIKRMIEESSGVPGKDGKSAYAYAQDGGYTGTEKEFAEKLAQGGGSGIHIGTEAPTDENVNVWIDTDEEAEEPTPGGSGIDVTAEVGQTIIVKAVDENGKPTEWESAEYQPRTHYKKHLSSTVLLGETSGQTADFGFGPMVLIPQEVSIKEGYVYDVTFNGSNYSCVAHFSPGIGVVAIGNDVLIDALIGSQLHKNTEEPFCIFYHQAFGGTVVLVNDVESIDISIVENVVEVIQIPNEYVGNTFMIRLSGGGTGEDGTEHPYELDKTWTEIFDALSDGKTIFLCEAIGTVLDVACFQRTDYRFTIGYYAPTWGDLWFEGDAYTMNVVYQGGKLTITRGDRLR